MQEVPPIPASTARPVIFSSRPRIFWWSAAGWQRFTLMARTLVRLLQEVIAPALDFRVVIAEVLLVMVDVSG